MPRRMGTLSHVPRPLLSLLDNDCGCHQNYSDDSVVFYLKGDFGGEVAKGWQNVSILSKSLEYQREKECITDNIHYICTFKNHRLLLGASDTDLINQ